MTLIQVHTLHPYNVCVGGGLLPALGKLVREDAPEGAKAQKLAVISDTNVAGLYLDSVTDSLKSAGFDITSLTIPAGEEHKTTGTYVDILEFLATEELTRSDKVVALGGGVVGDMAAFAAATYLRGIGLISVPTSLLAAVDSSVGGKTGVDLAAGKNLVGAFHQPDLVVCDTELLDTLPEEVYTDGSAEVIKYAILSDIGLYRHLRERGTGFDREYVVPRCIEIKRDFVEEDERDTGSRRLLNFGHTLAHAAELRSGYTLPHGHAVAAGMSHMMRAAASAGLMDEGEAMGAIALIADMGLPTHFEYSVDELMEAVMRDKKRRGSTLSLIVPHAVGDCSIEDMGLSEAMDFMRLGA